jgi:hypothetical protein
MLSGQKDLREGFGRTSVDPLKIGKESLVVSC